MVGQLPPNAGTVRRPQEMPAHAVQARLPLARVVYNVISATVWIAILLCALYLTIYLL